MQKKVTNTTGTVGSAVINHIIYFNDIENLFFLPKKISIFLVRGSAIQFIQSF